MQKAKEYMLRRPHPSCCCCCSNRVFKSESNSGRSRCRSKSRRVATQSGHTTSKTTTAAAANAAWRSKDDAAVDVAASISPVARLASHESPSSCTSFGVGKGSLVAFWLHVQKCRATMMHGSDQNDSVQSCLLEYSILINKNRSISSDCEIRARYLD